MYTIFCGYVWYMYGILSACYYWKVTVTCHYKNKGEVEPMDWKIDESFRKKALKFKNDYYCLFDEMEKPMEKLAGEVVWYLKQGGLWNDQDAVLNVICVLPGCHFRYFLYSHYYEITDKPHEIITQPECKVWKVDREMLLKIERISDGYEEKQKQLQQMESGAEKEILDYLNGTGLWDHAEAVHEMRCCLPICLLRSKLDERYYELQDAKRGDLTEKD